MPITPVTGQRGGSLVRKVLYGMNGGVELANANQILE